jgi:type II secretory pathway component PulJ
MPPEMTLPTGSTPSRRRRLGITFIEVMLTVIVLSSGLVALYRVFFSAIDQLEHLSARSCANMLIDSRIAVIERDFRSLKDFDIGELSEEVVLNGRPFVFQYTVRLNPVGTLLSVFELDVVLSWQERGRAVSIARQAYFSGITSLAPGGQG